MKGRIKSAFFDGLPCFYWVVLDGELAVPCYPQSALAGSNSRPEVRLPAV